MAKPIDLDLRRDLPKVRRAYNRLIDSIGQCSYSAPCAVGAMMTAAQRRRLCGLGNDGTTIDVLVERGVVIAPRGQTKELLVLQEAFDSGDKSRFDSFLTTLERKYREQVSA